MLMDRMLVALLAAVASVVLTASACRTATSTPHSATSPEASVARSVLPPEPTFTASAERGGGDAIGFCTKYGTVDFPARDARYQGSPLPLQITEILRAQPSGSYARPSDYYVYTAGRCAEGHVYVCRGGLAGCDYAVPSAPPNNAMIAYCRQNPQASYIPDVVVAPVRAQTVYRWTCDVGVPKVDANRSPVDAQGFFANAWGRLPEPTK